MFITAMSFFKLHIYTQLDDDTIIRQYESLTSLLRNIRRRVLERPGDIKRRQAQFLLKFYFFVKNI